MDRGSGPRGRVTNALGTCAGSRGVGMESWDASGGEPADLDAVTADSSTSLADFSWADTSVPKYVTRTAGFFIPPTDSDYQLRLIANAEAVVYLSTSESPADKVSDCANTQPRSMSLSGLSDSLNRRLH